MKVWILQVSGDQTVAWLPGPAACPAKISCQDTPAYLYLEPTSRVRNIEGNEGLLETGHTWEGSICVALDGGSTTVVLHGARWWRHWRTASWELPAGSGDVTSRFALSSHPAQHYPNEWEWGSVVTISSGDQARERQGLLGFQRRLDSCGADLQLSEQSSCHLLKRKAWWLLGALPYILCGFAHALIGTSWLPDHTYDTQRVQ